MVLESQNEYHSQWAALISIAPKRPCTPETLRVWLRQHERDTSGGEGLTTTERQRLKELERENRELRRSNVTSRRTHLHRNFQTVSITGIRTTPMEIEQCQKFDGLLTRRSITSPHGGPVASREQYCDLYDIPFKSLRQWPQDVAKAEQRANAPEIIPVRVSDAPAPVDTLHQHAAAVNEPVTLFLPGGIRMCCHPSQLTDVFRALRYAET